MLNYNWDHNTAILKLCIYLCWKLVTFYLNLIFFLYLDYVLESKFVVYFIISLCRILIGKILLGTYSKSYIIIDHFIHTNIILCASKLYSSYEYIYNINQFIEFI